MRVPGFRRLFSSTLAARIATQMSSVLLVLFVLQTRHDVVLSGIVVLCSQVPGIAVSPIAGALLDRGRRVSLMQLDYAVGATCLGVIAVLSLVGALPDVLLLLLVSAASLTTPLSRVGGRALYPVMVPRRLWDRSNAADSGAYLVATVIGPAIAGVAVALIGARIALFVPASVLLLAMAVLTRLEVPTSPVGTVGPLLADSWAAVQYVWRNRILRMLAGTMTVLNASSGMLTVAIPFIVLRAEHGTSTTVGLLFSVMGAAGILAGLVTGRSGTENREKRVLAASCLVTAGAFALLAISREWVLLVALIALVGAANGPLSVAMFSLRQRATEPEWFGRAFAVSMNLNFVGSPIGASIAGLLLTRSVPVTLIVGAACALFAGFWPAVLPASRYRPVPSDCRLVGRYQVATADVEREGG